MYSFILALPQPAPVSDLALISLLYDSNQYTSNRIKLKANWTQSKRMCMYQMQLRDVTDRQIYSLEIRKSVWKLL